MFRSFLILLSVLCPLVGCNGQGSHDIDALKEACERSTLRSGRTIELAYGGASLFEQLEAGEVVLTYDDGPYPPQTKKVLERLAEDCVPAVFFLRGDQAAYSPRTTRLIRDYGHAIGNHTYTHANLTLVPIETAREEIERAQTAIEGALGDGSEVRLFRFTFLAFNNHLTTLVDELELISVGATADALDWTDISHEDGVERVIARLEERGRRGVILLHDPYEGSLERTDLLLRRLEKEGYKTVAVTAAN